MKDATNINGTEPQQESQGRQLPKPINIIVNGRQKEVTVNDLDFEELVRLAFDDAIFNEVTIYTITFKRGQGNKPEGTLVAGELIKLKEGMIFNVARTDKS